MLLLLTAVIWPLSKSYDVVPYKCCIGTAPGDPLHGVTQYYRNTLDELTRVSVWVGDASDPAHFSVQVKDTMTDSVVAEKLGVPAQGSWIWLHFDFDTNFVRPVRGRDFAVIVTRENGAAISFAYDPTSPYKYGSAYVPGSVPTLPDSADVALRVYGLHDKVDSFDFACDEASWWLPPGHPRPNGDLLAARCTTARVKSVRLDLDWNLVQYGGRDSWDFTMVDSSFRTFNKAANCRVLALCYQVPKWASTRVVLRPETDSLWPQYPLDTSIHCPPKGLQFAYDSDNNLFGRFIRRAIAHFDTLDFDIHEYEAWNEPTDECTTSAPGVTGWWQHPNRYYAGDSVVTETVGPGLRPMCSLYLRLAQVLDSAVRYDTGHDPGHVSDRVVVGSMSRVNVSSPDPLLYAGRDWLDTLYGIAGRNRIPRFWNAISVHPYHVAAGAFRPGEFEADAETLRSIMRQHGDYGELWNTEFSMPGFCWWDRAHMREMVATEQQDADYCCEMFTANEGMKGRPGGSFDRNYWWLLRRPEIWGWGCWSLLESTATMDRHAAFYAFQQTAEQLTDKRFNRRVLLGDARDDSVRMYEFEDTSGKKTWLCWVNWPQDAVPPPPPNPQSVAVKLPARTNMTATTVLAYEAGQQGGSKAASADGWLPCSLEARPVFVSESGSVSRPELVVDSFWTVPDTPKTGWPAIFGVRVRNRDDQTATPEGCTTWVRLTWNDSVVDSMCTAETLPPGETLTESLHRSVPDWVHGDGLLAAYVNPGMRYMEKEGTDDNTAYLRRYVPRSPHGLVDAITPPGGKTNEPLVLFKLWSRSMEADTVDTVPCDSGLLIQKYFGLHDSVVHNTDTLGWFPFVSETCWTFLHGPGRYRFYLTVKDSWSSSDAISDTSDSIVVFDTVAAAGSVSVNSGTRFARTAACTLGVAVTDSGAGLRAMRIGQRLSNFTSNSGCGYGDGNWNFTGSGSGFDSALGMARLSVGTSGTSTMYQTIPAESLQSHWGDTLHLTADAIVSMPGAGTTTVGSLRVGCRFTHTDPPLETLTVVASIPFLGGIASHTGTSGLDTGFVITSPALNPFWQFAGGYVEAALSGSGTSGGCAFFDNVRLEVASPYPRASWWRPCTTAALWSLGDTSGLKVLGASLEDSAGNENYVPLVDSIILDNQGPCVHIGCPEPGSYVSDVVDFTGFAYDPLIPGLDTLFQWRRLEYRHIDSANWAPCDPDSVGYQPAWPVPPDAFLGSWNTNELEDGDYFVRLTVRDSASNEAEDQVWVIVLNGDMRGEFCSGPAGGGSGLGEGSIYVGSASGSVLHLSDDLDSLGAFSVADSGTSAYVTALLEVSGESLLVLDARSRRIQKLSKDGRSQRRLVSNLTLPTALARDENENLWLVDKGTNRVGKFRADGTLVFTRGGRGEDSTCLSSPEAIAIKGDMVYVADGGNSRLVVWDTAGDYQRSISGDFQSPTAVVVSDSGSIYITDGRDGKLKGINPCGGSFLAITEANGSRLKGLVASEDGHNLFTLAPQPNLVYKYRIKSADSMPGGVMSQGKANLPKLRSLSQPFPNPARTRLSIHYALPHRTRVSLKLYDIAGKLVTTLASGEKKPGYYNLTWNRQDQKGRTCACGVYFCTLSAENQRFSRKVVLTE